MRIHIVSYFFSELHVVFFHFHNGTFFFSFPKVCLEKTATIKLEKLCFEIVFGLCYNSHIAAIPEADFTGISLTGTWLMRNQVSFHL